MMNDLLLGQQLANFRVEKVIGRGGMAQVYYGWDVVLERPVAIKVIDARYRAEESYAERFLREARALARWRHEHIVQIYYAGEEDGLFYLVMEYVDGTDLKAVLNEHKAAGELLPQDEVIRIGRIVAGALDYAHIQGVIHRDVKPGNVLIAGDGRAMLTDFGLALDLQEGSSGEAFGSPRYIAPEQARRSTAAVPQSDLYSLGVILYEMLAGQTPFDDPSATALAIQHMLHPPPPPRDFNPALNLETEAVLLKALSKQPEERYQTGRALMDALVDSFTGSPAALAPLVRVDDELDIDLEPPTRVVSSTPVTDKVAEYLAESPRPPTPVWQSRSPAAPSQGRRAIPAAAAAGGLLLLCLVAVVLGVVAFRAVLADFAGVATTPGSAAGSGAGQEAAGTTSAQPATAASSGGPAPTVTLPAGSSRALNLFYNEGSFYVYNPTGEDMDMRAVAFEAVNDNGEPAGFAYDGRRWAGFYRWLEPGKCDALEVLKHERLRPEQCRGFNALITPEPGEPNIFWIAREGVSQFRVLWHEQEVGRCEIGAGQCQVTLP
ncbi:MAG: serine/threonine protein kinase [Chloroflexi bacterium]|nr:serine/threonine protein kinase [Chloroflexota bacterium]MCI0575784.1 serine/threonine protein kinase [Chloroflexota bacterium]MCI0643609.1 serine/threonine protein kinase [Chloroflexota bacterium]MCI0726827.1 serine/threonine protein kinase [Chloroflexota bacterium]